MQVGTVGCRAERARGGGEMSRQHQPVSHGALMMSETGFYKPKFQSREHGGAVECHREKHRPQERSGFISSLQRAKVFTFTSEWISPHGRFEEHKGAYSASHSERSAAAPAAETHQQARCVHSTSENFGVYFRAGAAKTPPSIDPVTLPIILIIKAALRRP